MCWYSFIICLLCLLHVVMFDVCSWLSVAPLLVVMGQVTPMEASFPTGVFLGVQGQHLLWRRLNSAQQNWPTYTLNFRMEKVLSSCTWYYCIFILNSDKNCKIGSSPLGQMFSFYLCWIMKNFAVSFTIPDLENDEELLQIDNDILELKTQNTDLESEMIKMRSEVSSLENHVLQQEKENNETEEQNKRLEDYLSVLKKESITLLSKLNIPHFNPALVTDENLEACIKQIQNLCSSPSDSGGGTNYYNAISIGASEIQVAWSHKLHVTGLKCQKVQF